MVIFVTAMLVITGGYREHLWCKSIFNISDDLPIFRSDEVCLCIIDVVSYMLGDGHLSSLPLGRRAMKRSERSRLGWEAAIEKLGKLRMYDLVGDWNMTFIFTYIENLIIPTDFRMFTKREWCFFRKGTESVCTPWICLFGTLFHFQDLGWLNCLPKIGIKFRKRTWCMFLWDEFCLCFISKFVEANN